jgi:cob(I)alamin adenosyltransferase
MKIYTKKGDKGRTFLADGTAHKKNEDIFEVIGTIDELNSWIGLCMSLKPEKSKTRKTKGINDQLEKIQRNLFSINSILANAKNVKFDVKRETKFLEQEIDKMERELPILKNFILPGGNKLATKLHVCRTVCRRAERRLASYQRVNTMAGKFIPYFNRLSDYFFALARYVNYKNKVKEIIWQK